MARRALLIALAVASAPGCSTDEPETGDGDHASTAGPEQNDAGAIAHAMSPSEPCARCHPQHVEEWSISPHAYAMRDPVFHAMVRHGQQETEGELGQFCVQCHTPIGVDTGQTEVVFDEASNVFTQNTTHLDADAMAGVSCDVCHSIVEVELTANASFVMQRDGVRRATIPDPVPTTAHESMFSALHHDEDICGTCHQVVNDMGFAVEATFREWVASRFNGSQTCQDCHMPEYEAPAALGERERTVHRHTFVGVDVSLLPEDEFPGYFEMRELAADLLRSSAVLTATFAPESRSLEIDIENLAGHKLPSGATADREMWLELLIDTPTGERVFESGTLDENGDLRVAEPSHTTRPGTDPQLVLYTQEMYFDPSLLDPPEDGPRERVEFLWEPNTEVANLVPTGSHSFPSYDLSSLPPGDYRASLRLLFRTFPPHLLRKLEELTDLDPAVKDRVPTVEMQAVSVDFTMP